MNNHQTIINLLTVLKESNIIIEIQSQKEGLFSIGKIDAIQPNYCVLVVLEDDNVVTEYKLFRLDDIQSIRIEGVSYL